MNRNIGTNPNREAVADFPPGIAGDFPCCAPKAETVADIADPYCLTVITTAGNCYRNGNFTVLRFADAVENADHLIQRAARLVAVGDVVFLGGAWREVSRVRRQGFSFLWDFADGKNAIRSQGEFVTVARIALAEAVAR